MNTNQIKDTIIFAIEKEIEASEFYRNASEKITTDLNLKKTFEELAEEELKHRKFLQDFLEGNIEELHIANVDDYSVSETIDKPKLSVEMKFVDAIALAMKNEEESMNMYSRLAEACTDAEQKEIFHGLAKMEKMHKVRLEEIYVNAAYTEVW